MHHLIAKKTITVMNHIPEGYHSVTPSLTCRNAAAALDFYVRAFGAVELFRMPEPDGKLMHAEMRIGNSTLMLSDEYPDWGAVQPEAGKGGTFMIYVPDADAAFAQAVAAGATELQPVTDQFWGDRSGRVACPYGYRWSLAQKVREVSPEEIAKAAAAWCEKQA
jgi:PhnB protein